MPTPPPPRGDGLGGLRDAFGRAIDNSASLLGYLLGQRDSPAYSERVAQPNAGAAPNVGAPAAPGSSIWRDMALMERDQYARGREGDPGYVTTVFGPQVTPLAPITVANDYEQGGRGGGRAAMRGGLLDGLDQTDSPQAIAARELAAARQMAGRDPRGTPEEQARALQMLREGRGSDTRFVQRGAPAAPPAARTPAPPTRVATAAPAPRARPTAPARAYTAPARPTAAQQAAAAFAAPAMAGNSAPVNGGNAGGFGVTGYQAANPANPYAGLPAVEYGFGLWR